MYTDEAMDRVIIGLPLVYECIDEPMGCVVIGQLVLHVLWQGSELSDLTVGTRFAVAG